MRGATLLPISTLTSVSDGHPTDLGTFSLPPSPAQSIHRYPLPTHISPVLRSHSVWAGISGKCGYYDGVPSLSSNSAVRTHCACPRALLRRTSGGRRGTTGHSFFHLGASTGFFPLDRACSSGRACYGIRTRVETRCRSRAQGVSPYHQVSEACRVETGAE